MKRKIIAVVLGVVVAVVLIIAIEALEHAVYPSPANLDVTDMEAMQAYVMGLPIGALLFVMGMACGDAGRRFAGLLHCQRNAAGLFGNRRWAGSSGNDY